MSSTTTPAAAAGPARSTSGKPKTPGIGDIVLVLLDPGVRRPLIITRAGLITLYDRQTPTADQKTWEEFRVSGTLCCEPEDHTSTAHRTLGSTSDPARIHGRADRHVPVCYGEHLAPGPGIGQWIPKPTHLPSL